MLNFISRFYFLSFLVLSFSYADNNTTKSIVDIVDYRFNSIRSNINGDISDIKSELQKLKEIQDDNISVEIINIDNSIKSLEQELEKSINDNKAFQKEYESGLDRYNEVVIDQDKKIQSIHSDLHTWGLGFLLVGLFTAIISFIFIRIFVKKARHSSAKEVNEILDRWLEKQELQEEQNLQEQNQLKDQIQYWQDRYEELKSDDKKLFAEFKAWSKGIEDKQTKSKIKKYIKKFQKENKNL